MPAGRSRKVPAVFGRHRLQSVSPTHPQPRQVAGNSASRTRDNDMRANRDARTCRQVAALAAVPRRHERHERLRDVGGYGLDVDGAAGNVGLRVVSDRRLGGRCPIRGRQSPRRRRRPQNEMRPWLRRRRRCGKHGNDEPAPGDANEAAAAVRCRDPAPRRSRRERARRLRCRVEPDHVRRRDVDSGAQMNDGGSQEHYAERGRSGADQSVHGALVHIHGSARRRRFWCRPVG
jgi:hypothetical protein